MRTFTLYYELLGFGAAFGGLLFGCWLVLLVFYDLLGFGGLVCMVFSLDFGFGCRDCVVTLCLGVIAGGCCFDVVLLC